MAASGSPSKQALNQKKKKKNKIKQGSQPVTIDGQELSNGNSEVQIVEAVKQKQKNQQN